MTSRLKSWAIKPTTLHEKLRNICALKEMIIMVPICISSRAASYESSQTQIQPANKVKVFHNNNFIFEWSWKLKHITEKRRKKRKQTRCRWESSCYNFQHSRNCEKVKLDAWLAEKKPVLKHIVAYYATVVLFVYRVSLFLTVSSSMRLLGARKRAFNMSTRSISNNRQDWRYLHDCNIVLNLFI